MIFTSIEHDRTARAVERQIEMLVLEGVLRVGDKLPGERELSKELNVSRPILREAIINLEERGLVITKHGDATRIADVIGTIFAPPIVRLIAENEKAKTDYLEYRRAIEGNAAAMAALRITPSDRKLLDRIVMDMRQAHDDQDPSREAELDVEFHSAIGDCAHNIVLLHTLRSCYRLLEDDVFYNRKLIYDREGMREKLLQQHMAIYYAVIAKTPGAAEHAAHAHIDTVTEATREVQQSTTRDEISSLRFAQHQTRRKKTG